MRENKLCQQRWHDAVNNPHCTAMLSHKFNIHTTVHMHSKSVCSSAESKAKSAISMVFADCVRNSVLISIGSSLHTCDPPTSQARLLAGNQDEHGFCDGQRGDARLSTVAGVAVARDGSIFFTDWMNHCVREITTVCTYIKTNCQRRSHAPIQLTHHVQKPQKEDPRAGCRV